MIPVLHLFPKLNASLIGLLEGLSTDQWDNATICKQWSVKDITAHLLDTALRRLSSERDGHFDKGPVINSYRGLVDLLNGLNADWVKAYRRISPEILLKQVYLAQEELYDHLLTLDPQSPALYPVSWAGEEESRQWFDIAREYTERWHHQQQIRLAVGAEPILGRDLYFPFLDISMLALPYHYSSMPAVEGLSIKINVVGEAGGSWTLLRKDASWQFTDSDTNTVNEVYIDQNIAWMLLCRGIDIHEAQQYWQVAGSYELGFHALKMTAFMV